MHEPYLAIDLEVIKNNVDILKSLSPEGTGVIAVIKSDAYGHGSVEICNALDSVDIFAVARLSEGLNLKKSLPSKSIMIFSGVTSYPDLLIAAGYDLIVVIHSLYQVELLQRMPKELTIKCWLKYDSGMHRLGFNDSNLKVAFSMLLDLKSNVNIMGVLSHFSSADDFERCEVQKNNLYKVSENLNINISFTNSAAFLHDLVPEQNFARLGISMYGISPFHDRTLTDKYGLKPAQKLIAFVISIREHSSGEPVGYNGTWTSKCDTKLAVVGIGYADGYPRSIKCGTPVLIDGVQYPIVGRVSMDLISVDIGLESGVKEGDEVTLWGGGLPIELIARCAESIPYELLTRVSKRVSRCYI